MKFNQLSIGDLFKTQSATRGYKSNVVFERVDTSREPMAEQRACNAQSPDETLLRIDDNAIVSRVRRHAVTHAHESMDISSGFGIGGTGSDDYSMATEGERFAPQFSSHKSSGQLWQLCAKRGCDNEPVCLDCEYCDRHCHCGE